jgi:hypothetical protein
VRGHHQAGCDCGTNEAWRFWVYILGDEGGAREVLIVCPGCGRPGRVELARGAASGAEPVEGSEGRVQAGVHA